MISCQKVPSTKRQSNGFWRAVVSGGRVEQQRLRGSEKGIRGFGSSATRADGVESLQSDDWFDSVRILVCQVWQSKSSSVK
jgi:hypothetical protein